MDAVRIAADGRSQQITFFRLPVSMPSEHFHVPCAILRGPI
jgi:hypothetical protein